MWPRVVMLLMVLVAPTSSLAATVCCDEGATDSCCGPERECPVSDDGECVLAAAGETYRTALPRDDLPVIEPGHRDAVAFSPPIAASESPPARAPALTPRYLLLQTLRN